MDEARRLHLWHDRIDVLLAAGGPAIAFQPVVELWGGKVVGHEALARFPEGSPDDWFGAAHDTGQGSELELAAIRNALNGSCPVAPAGAYIAVNLCPHVLCDATDGQLDFLASQHTRVLIEMTEHEKITDYAELAELLAPLRVAGVRLAIDDVGAGFASFRHILELAPDSIKLDRSIVAGLHLPEAEDQRALIAAMALFAARVGVRMIAEGVEVEEECSTLRILGVKYGQGYLFGRPAVPGRQPVATG